MVKLPKYSLGEEIFNAISHGIGSALAIAALVLMNVKADTPTEHVAVSLYGAFMIELYTISCVYHALSPRIRGKKVMRVIDHCNVYLMVYGTYLPIALCAIGGAMGWVYFGIVTALTILGITLSAINTDKFQVYEVVCHLVSGWSVLFAAPLLGERFGAIFLTLVILGGVAYSLGAILYGIGSQKKYMHSVFHIFCLAGTVLQWLAIYIFVL